MTTFFFGSTNNIAAAVLLSVAAAGAPAFAQQSAPPAPAPASAPAPAAATPAPAMSTAEQTDPVRLGWMQGSPPPADKITRFADGSGYRFPQFRWSFSNYRQLVPTTVVSRGVGAPMPLARSMRDDLDAVRFTP